MAETVSSLNHWKLDNTGRSGCDGNLRFTIVPKSDGSAAFSAGNKGARDLNTGSEPAAVRAPTFDCGANLSRAYIFVSPGEKLTFSTIGDEISSQSLVNKTDPSGISFLVSCTASSISDLISSSCPEAIGFWVSAATGTCSGKTLAAAESAGLTVATT